MNQLCDLSLVYAFAESRECITLALVEQVLQERNRGRAMAVFDSAPPGSAVPAKLDAGLLSERI